jgi:ribonuclease-3
MGGNAFEALVGAIYLDRGYDACMRFMQKRILSQIINIDKVAYKEVNFKSKLIEWSQKNRVKLEFKMVSQEKDNSGSPKFVYQVMIEGIACEQGGGYSKKESQQLASKGTLQRLRREPQLIDSIFAAKTDRTKMEEEPVENVPDTEEKASELIIRQERKPKRDAAPVKEDKKPEQPKAMSQKQEEPDEFDLSDITARQQSDEEIIAAAEAAAFAEQHNA